MKNHPLRLLFALCITTISCFRESDNSYLNEESVSSILFTKVSGVEYGDNDPFFVTAEDMDAYVNMLIVSGNRKKEEVLAVTPYGENGDISFYVVSFTEGWEMISSDKRGPIFLAKSDEGSFEEAISADYIRVWIGSLMQDITVRRMLEKEYGRTLSEEAQSHEDECVGFWQVINPNNLSSPFGPPTKMDPGLPVITLPDGHWELFSTVYTPTHEETVGHLCQTSWGQTYPYNMFCPPDLLDTVNCRAGCVAVSGAQMLKYLHDYLGTPVSAPMSLTIWGGGSNYSPNAWTLMQTDSTYIAMLIRDVGHKVGMIYGHRGSSANTSALVDNVFEPYGIGSTYGDYNVAQLYNSIRNDMPVIARADGKVEEILGVPIYSKGHSFIIDKCVYNISSITSTYHWIWDPHTVPVPELDDSISVSHSIVYTHIGMNWGWKGTHDELLFSPSGSWEILDYSEIPPDTLLFDYERKMIHGFNVL